MGNKDQMPEKTCKQNDTRKEMLEYIFKVIPKSSFESVEFIFWFLKERE